MAFSCQELSQTLECAFKVTYYFLAGCLYGKNIPIDGLALCLYKSVPSRQTRQMFIAT